MAKKAAKKKKPTLKAKAPAKKKKAAAAAAPSKAAPSKAAPSKAKAAMPRMGMTLLTSGSCPGDNCTITKPTAGEDFDPMESVDVWVEDTYDSSVRVVGVWAKIVSSVPSDCVIPDEAISLMQDMSNQHLWKGFAISPNDTGSYFVVCWVKIERVACKNNVGIDVVE